MISAGHRLEDIRCYTLRQVKVFADAVGSLERQRMLHAAFAARAASAGKEDFKHWVDSVEWG